MYQHSSIYWFVIRKLCLRTNRLLR